MSSRPEREPVAHRLAAFAGVLALVLVLGFSVGRAVGGTDGGSGAPVGGGGTAGDGHGHGEDGRGAAGAPTAPAGATEAGGLAVSTGGYTLVPEATELTAGTPGQFRFRVDGPDRQPVTSFAAEHDKPLHLVVVRRDLTGYQHLHPTMAADGTWSADLRLAEPGVWRAYADFVAVRPDGTRTELTLGTDLVAAGAYRPAVLPAPARTATVDGHTAGYEGTPEVGTMRPLLFRVDTPAGPAALEPYLGAYGHLVVLREGDLGYVHVHPEERLAGTAVKFWLSAPSPGRYRMFFDFQVAGQVRTAAYTLVVT
ncbi:MAG TPA: hypothetical protein VFM54_07110 [Micromonosporaceae bacterium]|nr:hypothetical protein [Micromonosporaceae bacterium]